MTIYDNYDSYSVGDSWDYNDEMQELYSDRFAKGLVADRPSGSASPDNAVYYATDENLIYQNDSSSGWEVIGHGSQGNEVPEGHYQKTVTDVHKSKKHPFIDVTHPDYGAVGDGETNDGAAIDAAIADAEAAGGGVVYFPQGEYVLDTAPIRIEGDNITLLGDGPESSVIDASTLGVDVYGFEVYGSEIATWAIASASAGEEVVTFSNSSATDDFSSGQLVNISADNNFKNTSIPEGEMNVVKSVDSTNDQITLKRGLQGEYSTSPEVTAVDSVDHFRWDSLGYVHRAGVDSYLGMILKYVRDADINNSLWAKTSERGIGLSHTFGSTVRNSKFEDMTLSGFGYGVGIGRAATSNYISNCIFTDTRHGVVHSSSSSGGIPRYTLVEGCTVTQPNDTYEYGLDSHEESQYVTFRDNELFECGIQIEGFNQKVIDNRMSYPSDAGVDLSSGSDWHSNIEIVGNEVIEPQGHALALVSSGVRNLLIENNTVIGLSDNSKYTCLFHGPVEKGRICNNHFQYGEGVVGLGDTTSVAELTREGVVVSGNTIVDSALAIEAQGTDLYSDCIVSSNVLIGNTTAISDSGFDSSCKIHNNIGVEDGETEVVSGTATLSSGAAVVSTGVTTTPTNFDVYLDPSGAGANASDVKASARSFWDNSAGEYKIEILEDGTSVGNPDIGYEVVKKV